MFRPLGADTKQPGVAFGSAVPRSAKTVAMSAPSFPGSTGLIEMLPAAFQRI
jgi:hypothetical protein